MIICGKGLKGKRFDCETERGKKFEKKKNNKKFGKKIRGFENKIWIRNEKREEGVEGMTGKKRGKGVFGEYIYIYKHVRVSQTSSHVDRYILNCFFRRRGSSRIKSHTEDVTAGRGPRSGRAGIATGKCGDEILVQHCDVLPLDCVCIFGSSR